MIATTLALAPRTRASDAMRDGWPATPAPDSVATARDAHTRHVMTTAALAIRRVVFVIAFPPADGHQAVGTLECGNAGLEGEDRQKSQRNIHPVRSLGTR